MACLLLRSQTIPAGAAAQLIHVNTDLRAIRPIFQVWFIGNKATWPHHARRFPQAVRHLERADTDIVRLPFSFWTDCQELHPGDRYQSTIGDSWRWRRHPHDEDCTHET